MKRSLVPTFFAGALALSGALAGDEPKREQPVARAAPAAADAKAAAAISDADLSLYPGSLFVVPDPPGFSWNDDDPGDNDLLARAFPIAPPLIPHAVVEFVPLTLRDNGCLDCHALDAGAEAPELPASHRTDLRYTPERVESAVVGARYLCLACHVPTSKAAPIRTSRLPAP